MLNFQKREMMATWLDVNFHVQGLGRKFSQTSGHGNEIT